MNNFQQKKIGAIVHYTIKSFLQNFSYELLKVHCVNIFKNLHFSTAKLDCHYINFCPKGCVGREQLGCDKVGPQERHEAIGAASASSGVDLHAETALETDRRQPGETVPHEGLGGREGAHIREVSERPALRQESQGARSASHKAPGECK